MGKTYLQGETLTAADLNASLSEAVNTSGYFVFAGIPDATAQYGYPFYTGEHVHNAKLTANAVFVVNTSPSYFLSVSNFANSIVSTNTITTSSSISDQIGNVRKVPINSVGSGYTLVALDSGKVISLAGGAITVPANIFQSGDTVTILNSSTTAVNLTITQGAGLTLYWAGQSAATTGNRILTLLGMCSILFTSATTAIITGSGIS